MARIEPLRAQVVTAFPEAPPPPPPPLPQGSVTIRLNQQDLSQALPATIFSIFFSDVAHND